LVTAIWDGWNMKILLVEDESRFAATLAKGLRHEGYAIDVVHDGAAALVKVSADDYDILILDRDLPGLSGDAVCSTLRAQGHPVRILMLTAAGTLDDRITGLDLGADAYLAKPFSFLELLAQLRALGRRATATSSAILHAGDIRLDINRRTVEEGGIPLRLTPKEYAVLEALLAASGAWVSADELLDEVWHEVSVPARSVVKTVVFKLRSKLMTPGAIESATAFGYRMVGAAEEQK